MNFDFDPARLKLESKFAAELLRARRKGDTARQKRRKQPAPNGFVKVPMLWVQCLVENRAGVNAYRVAHYVLHEAWRTNARQIKLTNTALAANGVDRKGKATALRQLREAGLISVEERPNRSPIVTVRFSNIKPFPNGTCAVSKWTGVCFQTGHPVSSLT